GLAELATRPSARRLLRRRHLLEATERAAHPVAHLLVVLVDAAEQRRGEQLGRHRATLLPLLARLGDHRAALGRRLEPVAPPVAALAGVERELATTVRLDHLVGGPPDDRAPAVPAHEHRAHGRARRTAPPPA